MKIIEENETIAWLNNKVSVGSASNFTLLDSSELVNCVIPKDSGIKTRLAKVLASLFEKEDESILWINEFGIWPSCENWNLFYGFRKSLGEIATLYDKPGHLFSKGDIETIASLVSMVLYFFWGSILVPGSKKFAINISHDEVITIFVRSKDLSRDDIEKLEELKNIIGTK